jgi:hypothetical protein
VKIVSSMCLLISLGLALASCKSSGSATKNHSANSGNYENWDANQPTKGDAGDREDCVMVKNGSGKWADTNCDEGHFFACKNDDGKWDVDGALGRGAWTAHDNNKCAPGYRFAAPTSADDNQNLLRAMGDDPVWIDLTDQDDEGRWISSSELGGSGDDDDDDNEGEGNGTFADWGSPPNGGTRENCAFMKINDEGEGVWGDDDCKNPHFFACLNKDSGKWTISKNPDRWKGGFATCKNRGAAFVAPSRRSESDALQRAMEDDNISQNDEIWINLTDEGSEGNWKAGNQ